MRTRANGIGSMSRTHADHDGDNSPKMTNLKIVVGGNLKDDAAAFRAAWHRAEAGDTTTERVLAFESWDGLAHVMTGERYRLLRHLHAQPAASVSALARANTAACTRMSQPSKPCA